MPRLTVVETVQPGPAPIPQPKQSGPLRRVLGKVLRLRSHRRNFGVVDEGGLYRSAQLSEACLRSVLTQYDIRTIIALNGEDAVGEMEQRVATELGVTRLAYPWIGDGTGLPKDVAHAMHAIADKDNWPLLIHCHAGAQRTTTAVLLYRYLYQGIRVRHTYEEHFHYQHRRGDWKVLAFLADYMQDIKGELAKLESSEAE